MADKLSDLHLANLHALAAELGVPRFRLLRREQLVKEIEARREDEPAAAEPEAAALLRERIESTRTNAELLAALG